MESLVIGLLMLFAFAVPWEYSLDLGEPFGNVARILGVLLLLAAIPVAMSRGRIRRLGPVQWLALLFYLYFACSYFWTVDGETTFEKMRAYVQVMMVVWLSWEFANLPRHLFGLLFAFVSGCWVLVLLTLLNFTSMSATSGQLSSEISGQIRFVAGGQDPNDVARFLDLGFPMASLLFAVAKRWPIRLLAVGYLPAGLLAVLLTASRGGFSGALLALAGSAALLLMWRTGAAMWILAGLGGILGGLWLLVPSETLARLSTIPEQLQGGDWNDRFEIWDAGWHAFIRSPWWGYGAGTYTTASGLATGDTAHNTAMALLVTGGVTGAAIFSAILAGVARSVFRTRGLLRVALGVTLVVWLITSMVGSVEENRATWLIFGIMALSGRLETEQRAGMEELFSGQMDTEWRARDPAKTQPGENLRVS